MEFNQAEIIEEMSVYWMQIIRSQNFRSMLEHKIKYF